MNLDEARQEEINKRLESLEKVDIEERLSNIEKHLQFFLYRCDDILKAFNQGVTVHVHEKVGQYLGPIKTVLETFHSELGNFHSMMKEMKQDYKTDSIAGTLKFMAKEVHQISSNIELIKKDGVNKKVHLEFTVDGYEMVKKSKNYIENAEKFDVDQEIENKSSIVKLLDCLNMREKKVIIHRFGLLGENAKSFVQMESLIGVERQRISLIEKKALRKCRLASVQKKFDVNNIMPLKLKKSIGGYEDDSLDD